MSRRPKLKDVPEPRKRRRATRSHEPMDWLALEALRLTATTFLRCGYSSTQLAARFRSFVANRQNPLKPAKRSARVELNDPGHVLTLWTSDPLYVDGSGMPRPLTVRGPAPSLEALVKRVRPKLHLQDAMHYLLKTGAVRKAGRRYIPIGEFVHHSAEGTTQSAHHLLVLYQLVRNFEFNSQIMPGEEAWPQRVVECPDFPVDELPALIASLRRRITAFTLAEDKLMSRIARSAPASAPRVRPVVNLFVSVIDPSGAPIQRDSA